MEMRYTIMKSSNKCILCIITIFFLISSSFLLKTYLQSLKPKGELIYLEKNDSYDVICLKDTSVCSLWCFCYRRTSKGYILQPQTISTYWQYHKKTKAKKRRKGFVSSESIEAISKVLYLAQSKFPLDSIYGIEIFTTHLFDVQVQLSLRLGKFHSYNSALIEQSITQTSLKSDFNRSLAKLGLEVTKITLAPDGHVAINDANKYHFNGSDYGYHGNVYGKLLLFPIFIQIRPCS